MASAVADLGEDDIPEHLLCPICFELPDSEVYQCVDGHVLCKACFVKLKECPHCRRSFGVTPPIRNRHFEAELEDLKANCPFNSNGCKEKLARNVLDRHKATCPYNFEKFGKFVNLCELIGFGTSCEFLVNKGNTKDAVDHLVTKHGGVLTEKTAFQMELASFEGRSSAIPSICIWTPVIAKQNDSFVLIVPLVNSMNAFGWITLLLEQLATSEILEVKYTLRTGCRRWSQAEIPLTLSNIEQSILLLDNDLLFSQSPFELSWMTFNFRERLIVDVKIRKNEEIKDKRNPGNKRIVCAKTSVALLPHIPKKKEILSKNSKNGKPLPPPPSRQVTVDKKKLFSLAINGDLQSFKSLVKEAPLYKNIKNHFGDSLLHVTMLDPDKKVGLEKAKFLVEEMNADLFVLTKTRESLLHFAARYSDDKAVKYFLKKGLEINAVEAFYRTPLHYVCYNFHFGEENAKMLLRYNPDCTLKNSEGMNPLEQAEIYWRPTIANLIKG